MYTFYLNNKKVSIFPASEATTPIIYLHTFSDEGQNVYKTVHNTGCTPFTLVSISNLTWNHDMSPWDSPPAFKNSEPCTGGADDYLRLLTKEIIPAAEKEISGVPSWRGIVGYSLAGLFALYTICKTDLFSRAGSISGSLWFPGIKNYLFSHNPKHLPDHIYLSLGDKESRTRNPVLKNVRQNTEEIYSFYQNIGIDTFFQLNPGNHYNHAVERTAACILWLLNR